MLIGNLKSIVVFVLLFSNTFLLQAQKEIGVSIGINNSGLIHKNIEVRGWEYKQSWFVGVNHQFVMCNKFNFLSEIQFSNKGWRTSNGDSQTYRYIDFLTSIDYILIRFLNVNFGFNWGILLNENSVLADRVFDPGIIIGMSLELNKIEFFTLYNTSIFNNETDTPNSNGYKNYNSNFQIGLRYTLKILE